MAVQLVRSLSQLFAIRLNRCATCANELCVGVDKPPRVIKLQNFSRRPRHVQGSLLREAKQAYFIIQSRRGTNPFRAGLGSQITKSTSEVEQNSTDPPDGADRSVLSRRYEGIDLLIGPSFLGSKITKNDKSVRKPAKI